MGILVDIFDEERRHLSERIGDDPPEKAVRIFPIGREGSRRLPMLSRIIALVVFASLVCVQSAWAVSLENPAPGSIKSGVGVISGWVCEADELEVSFNGGTLSVRSLWLRTD